MRLHTGTLFAGIIYLVIGLAFIAEAVGWWTLRVSDLRIVGPAALVVAGLAVVVGSLTRTEDRA